MAPRPSPRGNVPLLVASIASGLLLVTVVLAWAPAAPSPSSGAHLPVVSPVAPAPNSTAMANVTFVRAGSAYLVPAGGFEDVLLQLAMPGDVSGVYAATGNVTGWVLSTEEFRSFETNGTVRLAAWSAGPAPGAVLNLALPEGTWYLVFAALDSTTPTVVSVTNDIEAVFPLP